jgi:hypothetical protein
MLSVEIIFGAERGDTLILHIIFFVCVCDGMGV